MLSLEPCSPSMVSNVDLVLPDGRPIYEARLSFCFLCLLGSYSSPVFQTASKMAAMRRAMVSLARFGLVPFVSSRW